ncbi:hypothetical protein C3K47_14045 [Solitalea longa]|uniref:Organic solvent tolerance-like N-terminal domain-containing protein n=1 Tax=Solitalea longa TaxID=2079460 RepID=A0A2S4ZZX6_9SPHI|nr:OstA-like protein [Solitalea longa]POY35866.1 hypothetical protein C3K47_14045 [Solitalea longa]
MKKVIFASMKFRYLFFLLIFCICTPGVMAQTKTTRVQIENSDNANILVNEGITHFVGNCRFRHENALMFCDSATYFEKENKLDAFGNVKIIQADTITVTSKRLKYDGNTRKAELFEKVTLTDGKAVLTTEYLLYDMITRVGTYPNSGKITNQQNILTSNTGYYFVGTKDAFFRYNVKIKTPQTEITSDTIKYNTNTRVANFFGPTRIKGKDDFLYTENGWYNTANDQAKFNERSYYQSGSKTLRGDTLYYDRKAGFGKAVKNVHFIDTADNTVLTGGYGQYNKPTEIAFVTQKALLTMVQEKDTIYLTADTLKTTLSKPVTAIKPQPVTKSDSVKLSPKVNPNKNIAVKSNLPPIGPGITEPMNVAKKESDSAKLALGSTTIADSLLRKPKDSLANTKIDTTRHRILFAYHHVRLYKSDLQAVSDSLVYTYADSTMRCYKSPAVWTQGSQMTANQVDLEIKNKKVDRMKLNGAAFLVGTEGDSTLFNQISGKNMVGFFRDNKLVRLNVISNGESIYYPKEDSVRYTGMNRAICSNMVLTFKDNKLATVRMDKDVEGSLYPLDKIASGEDRLKGFIWRVEERPVSKEDIYRLVAIKEATDSEASEAGKPKRKVIHQPEGANNPPKTPVTSPKKKPAIMKKN